MAMSMEKRGRGQVRQQNPKIRGIRHEGIIGHFPSGSSRFSSVFMVDIRLSCEQNILWTIGGRASKRSRLNNTKVAISKPQTPIGRLGGQEPLVQNLVNTRPLPSSALLSPGSPRTPLEPARMYETQEAPRIIEREGLIGKSRDPVSDDVKVSRYLVTGTRSRADAVPASRLCSTAVTALLDGPGDASNCRILAQAESCPDIPRDTSSVSHFPLTYCPLDEPLGLGWEREME
ncbi:hypothetical protein RRG08_031814 [Elysia crispata]|uniref:Uncharacterized protein n=1 Tax=Elysia crispata TaxID=231223 RepID=A0AAE0Y648_9GAST|nr:hypothetical protein RRG08_031814 [Elysia crispata]